MAIHFTDRINDAVHFMIAAHDSINHRRKYSYLPYWTHTLEVAKIVSSVIQDEDMIIAAFFHDIVEDVFINNAYYSLDKIREKFGDRVANLVDELTDRFTKANYPDLNRKARHTLENERKSKISNDAKTIKLADNISNGEDIGMNDENFARLYIEEIADSHIYLRSGDEKLWNRVGFIIAMLRKKFEVTE